MPKPDPAEAAATAPQGSAAERDAPGDATAGRRALLGKVTLGAGAGAALVAGWPLLAALGARVREPHSEALPFLDVAAESELGKDPLRVALRAPMRDGWLTMLRDLGAAWLVKTPGGIEALSAICPHLGCGVERYGPGYFCPCHDSKFDARGERKSGPSPRGLDRLAVRVENGRVLVQPLAPGFGDGAKG